MHRLVRRMITCGVLLSPASLTAQGVAGNNVDVDVVVTNAKWLGNELQVSYVVHNRPTSSQRLFEFTIRVPQGSSLVTVAAAATDWVTISEYRGQSVAQWGALGNQMQPGDSSPVLSYTAPGILDIVSAWVRGYVPPQPLPPEDSTNRVFHPEPDPAFDESKEIQVVGIVLPPSGSAADIAGLISSQVTYACGAAGWVAPAGICNSLSQKLAAASASLVRGDTTAARNQLGAFQHELDAQRGKHVSDNAYWLLKTNTDYVLMHL